VKAYRGSRVQILSFLSSTEDGGEWQASQSGHLSLRERIVITCLMGGRQMGPRTYLDVLKKRSSALSGVGPRILESIA
jgi:hypothetical protein